MDHVPVQDDRLTRLARQLYPWAAVKNLLARRLISVCDITVFQISRLSPKRRAQGISHHKVAAFPHHQRSGAAPASARFSGSPRIQPCGSCTIRRFCGPTGNNPSRCAASRNFRNSNAFSLSPSSRRGYPTRVTETCAGCRGTGRKPMSSQGNSKPSMLPSVPFGRASRPTNHVPPQRQVSRLSRTIRRATGSAAAAHLAIASDRTRRHPRSVTSTLQGHRPRF